MKPHCHIVCTVKGWCRICLLQFYIMIKLKHCVTIWLVFLVFDTSAAALPGAATRSSQQRTKDHDEKGEKDTDGERAENIDQHVWVAALPEDSTQHLCRIISDVGKRHGVRLSRSNTESMEHWLCKLHTWSRRRPLVQFRTPPQSPRKPSMLSPWQQSTHFLWRAGQSAAAHRGWLKDKETFLLHLWNYGTLHRQCYGNFLQHWYQKVWTACINLLLQLFSRKLSKKGKWWWYSSFHIRLENRVFWHLSFLICFFRHFVPHFKHL